MKAETDLTDQEELELTDDECYEQRHKQYEDEEISRYNIGLTNNKKN